MSNNAYEVRRREAIADILSPDHSADEQLDALCVLVEDEVRSAYQRGVRSARERQSGGQWPSSKPQWSTAANRPHVVVDRARRTSAGHALNYSSAVQARIIKRVSKPEAGL